MFIVVGPSGAGKSSFLEKVIQEVDVLRDAITCTTRSMRKGEAQGEPYFFISKEEFEDRIKKGYFVEWANVHGKLYGTPKEQITRAWEDGKALIMDVDIQGAKSLKNEFPQEAVTIFIKPLSINVLRQRVLSREGKAPEDIEVRMANAEKELAVASEFDYQVVNDQFEESYTQFKKIIEDSLKPR